MHGNSNNINKSSYPYNFERNNLICSNTVFIMFVKLFTLTMVHKSMLNIHNTIRNYFNYCCLLLTREIMNARVVYLRISQFLLTFIIIRQLRS